MTEKRKKWRLNAYAKGLLTIVLPILILMAAEWVLSRTFTAPEFLFSYEELQDGTIALTKYKGISSYIIFPSEIDGKQVTVIRDMSNSGYGIDHELKGAEIPEGVKELDRTFFGCRKLQSVKLPESLEAIGDYAFAFSDIRAIDIPENVKTIGAYAFSDCKKLEHVGLNEGLRYIDDYAFCVCTSLYNIDLPDSIEDFGCSVFSGSGFAKNYPGDFFIVKDKLLRYKGEGGSVTVPDSVRKICGSAFSGTAVTDITLSVDWIGSYAFASCPELERVEISGNTVIETGTFHECAQLERVILDDKIQVIPKKCFEDCTSLKIINTPAALVEIGAAAFKGCSSLYEFEIGEKTEILGRQCFAYSGIESVYIPDSVKEIGDSCFEDCTSLKIINTPAALVEIGAAAFKGCSSLYEFEIGEKTEILGRQCFAYSGIESVYIPDSVKEIGDSCFENCTYMKSIRLSGNTVKVGGTWFRGCEALEYVELPDGIAEIEKGAFEECPVTMLYIPESVENLGIGPWESNSIPLERSAVVYYCEGAENAVRQAETYTRHYKNGIEFVKVSSREEAEKMMAESDRENLE